MRCKPQVIGGASSDNQLWITQSPEFRESCGTYAKLEASFPGSRLTKFARRISYAFITVDMRFIARMPDIPNRAAGGRLRRQERRAH